jgi:hypothetical protein
MRVDNELPEGTEEESEQVQAPDAGRTSQQTTLNISTNPDSHRVQSSQAQSTSPNSLPETLNDFSDHTSTAFLDFPQIPLEAQDDEFDFDGAYSLTNGADEFMQEALNFLRRHPRIGGYRLRVFHLELLDRYERIPDLDELKELLQ